MIRAAYSLVLPIYLLFCGLASLANKCSHSQLPKIAQQLNGLIYGQVALDMRYPGLDINRCLRVRLLCLETTSPFESVVRHALSSFSRILEDRTQLSLAKESSLSLKCGTLSMRDGT